jgi:hypothetical protein
VDIDGLDLHALIRDFLVYLLFNGIGNFNALGERIIHFGVAKNIPQGLNTWIILLRSRSTKKPRMPIQTFYIICSILLLLPFLSAL